MDINILNALDHIPPDLPRDDWYKILGAIKSELADAGREIAENWSKGGDSYKEADFRSTWNSLNGNGGIGIGTLFYFAKQHGFKLEKSHNDPIKLNQEGTRETKPEKQDTHALVAMNCVKRWSQAAPADKTHPYLVNKGCRPYGVKQEGDNLLIPMQDADGNIWSLQTISEDGKKLFAKGGKAKGMYCRIKGDGPIVICEGFATGSTIREATGYNVAITFSCNNLEPVARTIRQKLPDHRIIIAADSAPVSTTDKARKVAQAINADLAIPAVDSDFNDLFQEEGFEAVRVGIDGAETCDQLGKEPAIEWGVPGPIEARLKPVPALSEQLIPEPFRKWILDVSHRMQTPPDFAAVTALTVTASIIGTACAIRPKQRDNWTVIPNLWGACIGRPSVVLKSPSMKEPMDMLSRLQAEAGEVYEGELRAHEFDKKVLEAEQKVLENGIKAASTGKERNPAKLELLKQRYLAIDDTEEPVRRLFKTNETSIQSQTVLQTQNPRGLLTFRDEITGLLTRWDKKDHEDERAYFLEGWNGDGGYTDFKIGRRLTDAAHICISLFGGIQPDKLRRYLYQSMNGGNDGLVQRLQLAVYPDEPQSWQLVDQYPDTQEKTRVYEILQRLADMDFTRHEAEQGEYDRFPFLRFSSEGQEVFNEWLTDLQTDKLPNEDNPLMAEHMGKYRSLMPTLALVFHLIGIADGTATGHVSKEAAIQAAAWCDYLEEHARRIYGTVMSPEREAAAILVERIHKLPNPFTAKEVYRRHWSGLPDTAAVEAACGILEEEDWLDKEPGKSTGGRPLAARYWMNPAVVGQK